MRLISSTLLPLPLPLLPLALLLAAPAVSADALVKARLDARGVKYEVDKDGDYKVTYSFSDENRTQLLFVSGTTEEVAGMKIRQVFSPAARVGADGINGEKALALLRAGDGYKVGAWEIAGDILYFVAKVPDSLDAAALEDLMDIVASIADDKEIELTGGKDAL